MILCAHQPVYLPGAILFSKIALCDAIVLIGHVQLEKSSWQTRNKIRDGKRNTPQYLSVPVRTKGRFGQSINDTEMVATPWVKKHLRSIFLTYKDRPYFEEYFEPLKRLLEKDWSNLSQLNNALIKEIMKWLNLSANVFDSRDLNIQGSRTEMLISICKVVGATDYISNPGAAAYLDERSFIDADIRHHWQKFTPPIYDQGHSFLSDLSVIDMLFNLGSEAGKIVRSSASISS